MYRVYVWKIAEAEGCEKNQGHLILNSTKELFVWNRVKKDRVDNAMKIRSAFILYNCRSRTWLHNSIHRNVCRNVHLRGNTAVSTGAARLRTLDETASPPPDPSQLTKDECEDAAGRLIGMFVKTTTWKVCEAYFSLHLRLVTREKVCFVHYWSGSFHWEWNTGL